MEPKNNQEIVLEFYRKAIGEQDLEFAAKAVKEDYIQHNPYVRTGREGFLEALRYLKQMPKPENPTKPFMRVIAENEYVILHLGVEIGGVHKVVLDIFRVEDGIIAEHWDAIQDVPEVSLAGNSMIEGPVEVKDKVKTSENKQLVKNLYEEVLIGNNYELLEDFIHPDLIQHHPRIKPGQAGIKEFYEGLDSLALHRTFGQGNFVVTQASGTMNSVPRVFYTIFRIEAGKIMEQWSVSQQIPEQMAHGNGMI